MSRKEEKTREIKTGDGTEKETEREREREGKIVSLKAHGRQRLKVAY